MKTIIKTTAIAICTFVASAVQAQVQDWANAPINPIPFEYTANHHHFVGDVDLVKGESEQIMQFDKDGLLVRSFQLGNMEEYVYNTDKKLLEMHAYEKSNNGENTVSLSVIKFQYEGDRIIKMETASKHWLYQKYNKSFVYNNKGLLVAITRHNGDVLEQFEYDEKGRLSHSLFFDLNNEYGQDDDTRYSYEQEGDFLKVTDEYNTSYYNKQGFRSNDPSDLEFFSLDERGNVIQTLEGDFGYFYRDGLKTGNASLLAGKDVANSQIIDAKKRYAGLNIIEDK